MLATLVIRKKAMVRRPICSPGIPWRRNTQAPRASPPAPPTESNEFAASSPKPSSAPVRQLMRRQKTVRNTTT